MPASPTPCDAGVVHAAAPAGGTAARWVLITTILGSGISFLDSAGVGVALPVIQRELHAGIGDVQLVEGSYTLLLAALMLLGGSLGDRYGRRRVFTIGVALFMLASLGCALAPTIHWLVVARGLQGIGGACMVPGSLAILSSAFDGEARGRAIGIWSGYTAIMAALGPLAAGWILQHLSWRWVFLINLPLGALVMVLAVTRVPESQSPERAPLDLRGAALATLALAGLALSLVASSWPGHAGLPLPAALGGGACLILFVLAEQRSPHAMMPLGLFAVRRFAGANGLTLFLYLGFNATLFLLPFNLVGAQGYSPLGAGMALLPLILIMFTLSRWAGGLVARRGPTLPLVVGPVVTAAGFALLARPDVGGSYFTTYFPAIVVLGLGMTISVAPLTTVVMESVETRHAGVASGINNTVSGIAGLLAIAAAGPLLLWRFAPELARRVAGAHLPPDLAHAILAQRARLTGIELPASLSPARSAELRAGIAHAFASGFRAAALLSAGLSLAAAGVAGLTIRGAPAAGKSTRLQ